MKRIMKMKRRTKGLLLFISIVVVLLGGRLVAGLLLQEAPPVLSTVEEALRARALELHHDAIMIDAHNEVTNWITDFGFDLGMDGNEAGDRYPLFYAPSSPFSWLPNPPHGENVGTHTDFARMREGGLDAPFFVLAIEDLHYESGVPGQSWQRALDMFESLQESVRRHPDEIEFAYTAADVESIVSEGKFAALIAIEGGHAIEEDLENLRHFYDLGIRRMTLTHNVSLSWADAARDVAISNGLSEFGRDVVREMNHLGMIVDISHVSDEAFWDVLKVTSAPIIASHSNARALADSPRNLTDGMLRAVADNGGVVGIVFEFDMVNPALVTNSQLKIMTGWHWFTHPRGPETPLSLIIDHIDHVVQVAGIDHVGIGSDLDGLPFFLPKDLKDVGDFPNITVELVRRGYSDEDIRKILGGNMLRVLADVERVATQLSKDKALQTEADFTGFITEIHPVGKGGTFGQILVESHIDKLVDKYMVTIKDETLIFEQDGENRRQVAFEALETKQKVEVWFTGPIMESFPMQGTAQLVVITE